MRKQTQDVSAAAAADVCGVGPACAQKRSGSALIVALWTIMLLSMLVMSFALDAMLEGRIGTYVRQRRRVDYLTQSGVVIAEMLLIKQTTVTSASAATDTEDRWRDAALRLKRGQTAVVDEPIGDGAVHVEIIPEPARWNVNKLIGSGFDSVWEQIFTVSGLPQDYFSGLIDCWNDWVDADSSPAKDGAEDEYYKSLEPPYKPRNGIVDTVDELRLIKGFVPAILDGGVLNPQDKKELQITVKGIKELFTTYGDGKINVNAAPMEVLMTIPGVDEITAGAIVEEREGASADHAATAARGTASGSSNASRTTSTAKTATSAKTASSTASSAKTSSASSKTAPGTGDEPADYSFSSVGDFMSRIPGLDPTVANYVTVVSGTFRIVIDGQAAGITHRIQAIAECDNKKVRYLRWREDP